MDCSFIETGPEKAWCRLISDSKHPTGDRMESYGHWFWLRAASLLGSSPPSSGHVFGRAAIIYELV
jgi:hypothetical protein